MTDNPLEIIFHPTFGTTQSWAPEPIPAAKAVPQWYRDADRINEYGEHDLKLCVPFLDAMMAGYMLTTPTDLTVIVRNKGKKNEETLIECQIEQSVDWRGHHQTIKTLPRPHKHKYAQWAWVIQYGPQLPTGWSALFTHPLNRHDLPFTTMSGFVDSDKWKGGGLFPFFLKDDFEGIIPQGTPYCQIIPIQRQEWTHRTVPYNQYRVDQATAKLKGANPDGTGGYRKYYWQKKRYS